MIKGIFKAIVWVAGFIVVIDFIVAVATNSEPFLQKLIVGIGLLLVGGALALVLLVRDTIFLDFGSASEDLQLLVELSIAFLVENTVDFIDLFMSIAQFIPVMIGEALDAVGGTVTMMGVTVTITSTLTFSINLGGIGFDFTFYVKQLRFTLAFGIKDVAEFSTIFSMFGGGEQFRGYDIGYFSMGVVVEAITTTSVAIFSLQETIITAIESFLKTRTLEDVVRRIVEKF